MPGFELFGEEERKHINDVMDTGIIMRYGFEGPRKGVFKSLELEKKITEVFGCSYAQLTSSGTAALTTAMAALGIGFGDEIIMPSFTFVASFEAVLSVGAIPVLVDIDETLTLNPDAVRAAITPKTKAIVAVHLYGNLCEMDRLLAIGEKHGIPVIEDAAEAIGSVYQNKRAGSMGRFGAFSFHGTKTMTTGEGGIFVTNDAELYERVLTLSNHGRARGQTRQFWPDVVGYKYKMSNIQAAIGCAQLERIEELTQRKREIFSYYREFVASFPFMSINPEPEGIINGAWMPTVVFSPMMGLTSQILQAAFTVENIDARVFFHPLSSLPMFEEKRKNIKAWDLHARAINLPSYHDISVEDQTRICSVLSKVSQVDGGGF